MRCMGKRCLLVVSSLIVLLSSCGPLLPDDEKMMAEFYENEAQFEILLKVVRDWEISGWIVQKDNKWLSSRIPSLTEAEERYTEGR